MPSRIVLTILTGVISGLLGGTLGLVSRSVMYPLLIFFNIIPDHKTLIGTLLFILMFPISLFAVWEYKKRQQIDYLIGIILFVTFLFASYCGSFINKLCDDKMLKLASAFLFLFITIYLFYDCYFSDRK